MRTLTCGTQDTFLKLVIREATVTALKLHRNIYSFILPTSVKRLKRREKYAINRSPAEKHYFWHYE